MLMQSLGIPVLLLQLVDSVQNNLLCLPTLVVTLASYVGEYGHILLETKRDCDGSVEVTRGKTAGERERGVETRNNTY